MINGIDLDDEGLSQYITNKIEDEEWSNEHVMQRLNVEEIVRKQTQFMRGLVVLLRKKAIIIDSEIEELLTNLYRRY